MKYRHFSLGRSKGAETSRDCLSQFNNLLKYTVSEENKEMKILCIGNSSGIYVRTTQEGLLAILSRDHCRRSRWSSCAIPQYMPLLFPIHNIFISLFHTHIPCLSKLLNSFKQPSWILEWNSSTLHAFGRTAISGSECNVRCYSYES